MTQKLDSTTQAARLEQRLTEVMKRVGRDGHVSKKDADKVAKAATALCETPEGRMIFEERFRDDFERAASGDVFGKIDPKARDVFAKLVEVGDGMDVMNKFMGLGSAMAAASADKKVDENEANAIRKAVSKLVAAPGGREIFDSMMRSDFEKIAAGEVQDGVTVEPKGQTVFQTMLKEIGSKK